MPYSVKYNEAIDCIYVVVVGELELSLFRGMATEVAHCIKNNDCHKILNDLRKAEPSESAGDTYFMPKHALKAGVSRSIKRALIVTGSIEKHRFLETVFVNQGNVVRLFNRMEEAKRWLFGDDSDS